MHAWLKDEDILREKTINQGESEISGDYQAIEAVRHEWWRKWYFSSAHRHLSNIIGDTLWACGRRWWENSSVREGGVKMKSAWVRGWLNVGSWMFVIITHDARDEVILLFYRHQQFISLLMSLSSDPQK
jgi:hypothetical protein